MNDPHVVALLYIIEHGRSVDYSKAKPVDHEEAGFRVKITNRQMRFEFKEHYATEDAARKAIEDYVRAWEFSACLESGPDSFKLKFCYEEIEDRKPTPGVFAVNAGPVRFEFKLPEPTVLVSRACYPPPPSGLKVTPDVQAMYERYMGYLRRREPLPSMAYFCWTMVKGSPMIIRGFSKGDRHVISYLCSKIGGKQARKRIGVGKPLTAEESRFLEKVIKVVIRRAAEEGLCLYSQSPQDIVVEPSALRETLRRWRLGLMGME